MNVFHCISLSAEGGSPESHDETFKTFIMENRANVRGKNILVDLFTPIAGENCYL